MSERKWIEPIVLILLFGVGYFIPVITAQLPVFWGEFNSLDGSLQAVRFMDVLVSAALVLLISRLVLPRRLSGLTILRFLGFSLLLLLTVSLVEMGWDWLTLRVFNLPTAPGEVSDKMLAYPHRETLNLSVWAGNLSVLMLGIFYGLLRDRNQQSRNQERLEKDKLEAEIKFLRSQINPHFLFNTLNNIYAITQRNEDSEGSDALLRLSGLMRYMLYDSDQEEILLSQEIEHLRNYRDLLLLRYSKHARPEVSFQVEGDVETCRIAPLILLPFVENAFKHGINNKGEGTIEVNIAVKENKLDFRVLNTNFADRTAQQEHKGIGQENIKRRLDHLYPDRHKLEINAGAETYEVNLEVSCK